MNPENALSFPLTFAMKIIMKAEAGPVDGPAESPEPASDRSPGVPGDSPEAAPGALRERLEAVFSELEVPVEGWSAKPSGEGRYVSYTVSATVRDREEFELLHARIAAVNGVRYIL